jgi:asparaginyl-tRNA synthetase
MRYYISDLKDYVGQKIELKGWAYNTRSSGKVKFLELRDGTGIVPCIFFKADCGDAAYDLFDQMSQESSVRVVGTVREHPKRKGEFEIGVVEAELLGKAKIIRSRRKSMVRILDGKSPSLDSF